MKKFDLAVGSLVRNAVFGTLVMLGLAACGDDATTASTTGTSVQPNVGMINRTPVGTTSHSTPPASNTTTVASSPTVVTPPVKSVSTGTATLDWTPPTENSDGTTLTNLAGYTVYYGTSPNALTESVKVSNPGLTAYTLSNLAAGTWYFAVTAYSATGVESSRTTVISTTI